MENQNTMKSQNITRWDVTSSSSMYCHASSLAWLQLTFTLSPSLQPQKSTSKSTNSHFHLVLSQSSLKCQSHLFLSLPSRTPLRPYHSPTPCLSSRIQDGVRTSWLPRPSPRLVAWWAQLQWPSQDATFKSATKQPTLEHWTPGCRKTEDTTRPMTWSSLCVTTLTQKEYSGQQMPCTRRKIWRSKLSVST